MLVSRSGTSTLRVFGYGLQDRCDSYRLHDGCSFVWSTVLRGARIDSREFGGLGTVEEQAQWRD